MKTIQLTLCGLLVALMGYAPASQAEDIDIYSGTVSNGTPNVMFVIDNASNSNANMEACTYSGAAGGGAPNPDNKSLASYQCALANIVAGMTPNADGSAVVNLGITIMCGVLLPLTPIDNNVYAGAVASAVTITKCSGPNEISFTIPMGTTNKNAFIIAAKALITNTSGATQGAELQETWAYYTGGNGINGGVNTAVGILSGLTYAGTNAINGCQKNYIIFLSGVAPASHGLEHSSHDEIPKLQAATANGVANGTLTAAQKTELDAIISPSLEAGYGREWARFMKTLDVNTTPAPVAPATTPPEGTGIQSIITYSVATGDTAVPPADITSDMEQYIKAISTYGGGKYYPAGDDSSVLTNAILNILNEVQAVNSVFSSSSLPVSVNAQGTYLNQIYMGMFRPDPDGYPRWVGNLKQYHFTATRDLVTHLITLSLSDSLDASAINPATGFISPNAVSYWTCGGSGRVCSPVTDVVGGFWVNDALKQESAGGDYDSPDGEWVDKGGAAQTARLANKANVYSTVALAATDTRRLYTCTGTCANTDPAWLLSSYPFANSNASLTPDVFGIISPKNITSLTRSGGTATIITAVAHGVQSGQLAQVSGAEQSGYDGSFVMTRVDDTHLTYTPAVSPTTNPSGTITATVPTAGVAITSLTRAAGGATVTVTAAGNGLKNGDSVSISGVTPTAYNGTWTVICAAVAPALCGDTFTFTGTAEGPVTPSGSGTATVGTTSKTIELVTATQGQTATPGLTRSGTTVTVRTTAKHGFAVGNSVTIANAGDSGYNATARSILTKPDDYTFTYALPSTTPANPTTLAGATASQVSGSTISISSLALALGAGDAATVTGTTASDLTALGGSSTFTISGANQSQYNGTHAVTITSASVSGSTFTYSITTTPATTATGTMTLGSSLTAPELINWVRGEDNAGDEHGPGGSVTVRPSLHGDVLHSRPVAVNYGTHPITILSTSDSGATRTATASEANISTIKSLAAAERVVMFANEQSCLVTTSASTTEFTYSTTNCGASGAQAATVGPKVVVYYGGNDGVFRAVNGNQTAAIGTVPAGGELWGFIPSEFFNKLKRLHDNNPILDLPSTVAGILPTPQKKDYFADGSTGIYQKLNADGTTNTAWLYLSMRRGGRLLYALNITEPTIPKFKWKITNTGDFTELGQTWSAPKVATIKGYCGKNADNSLIACAADTVRAPVLIFGAGYDTAEDSEPAGARTMGRGIYIVDAATGALVWRATYGASSVCTDPGVSPAICTVLGMNYSIPSDLTLMDSDSDGFIDRLYAVDMGGNVWRVDLQRSSVNYTPDYWRVNQVASLGGDGTTRRKFFYPPDVMYSRTYDAVLVGSGDREHPFSADAATTTAASDGGLNRMYMLRDITGNDGSGLTTITNGKLFNATSTAYTGTSATASDGTSPNKGYFINLASKEKVVNAPLTVAGYTYFGTNQPTSTLSCSANLGIAKGYKLNPLDGTFTYTVYTGGGLPPSPVAGVVSVTVQGESTPSLVSFIIGGGGDPGCVGADCGSAIGGGKPIITVPTTRRRTYWYQEVD